MNEKEFVASRQSDWEQLTMWTDRAESGLHSLKGKEIRDFGKLYRRVAGDLAAARTAGSNPALILYLNDLIARGNSIVYRHPRRSWLRGLMNMVVEACIVVRRRKVFILVSIGITIGSGVLGASVVKADPKMTDIIMPDGFRESLEGWKKKEFRQKDIDTSAAATGFYITNNTNATLMAVAGGMSFGVMTVYSLFSNGLLLGTFAAEMSTVGGTGHFFAGIAAHGVTEFGGILIGGAAGLLLGFSLINPGRRTRAQSVRAVARDAMYLMGIGVLMIWIAAPIEGWVSFTSAIPDGVRIAIGLGSLVAWLLLFSVVGRNFAAETVP